MGESRTIAKRLPSTRSRVTNGRKPFIDGDGRSQWARRRRDLVALHAEDLGPIETLSEAQLSLCRRAAALEVELEGMEGCRSEGGDINLDVYSRSVGHLRRCFEAMGIERRAKDVTPTLAEYIANRRPPPMLEAAE